MQTDPAHHQVTFCQQLIKGYTGGHFPSCPTCFVSGRTREDGLSSGYAMNSALNTEVKDFEYLGKEEQGTPIPSQMIVLFDARVGMVSRDFPDIEPAALDQHVDTSVIFINDESVTSVPVNKQPPGALRHQGGASYVFLDGHVRWLKPTAIRAVCDESHPCYRMK